jgi:hypothetical protein
MFCILILWLASPLRILGKSRMRKRARTDLCGVVPWKLMEFSFLKWRPRQSLARSRVPSLAWWPVTAAAKRRPGGLQARTAVNGKITPKSIVIEVADLIPRGGRQKLSARFGECAELLPGFVPLACNQRVPWEQGRSVRLKPGL